MPEIQLDDATFHFERAGRGPAMLFMHGMCGGADVWADQVGRFVDRYTCVSYDRRGHSRSGRGHAPITPSQHADDAAALIDALELAPCLVVASSGGAAITVDLALRHGRLLRGVVLSEPPLLSLDPDAGGAAVAEIVAVVDAALATGGPRAAVDAFFARVCPGLWSTIGEDRKDRYRANADIGLADLQSPPLRPSAADLAGIAVPALVLAGTKSHPALRSVARRLAGALPDARFIELAGSGHVTYAEQPDAFAAAVSAFAAEIDRRVSVTAAPARGAETS
ncbi:MAG: alpha/beta fold hydrolase [Acidimicrobiales bacterium]